MTMRRMKLEAPTFSLYSRFRAISPPAWHERVGIHAMNHMMRVWVIFRARPARGRPDREFRPLLLVQRRPEQCVNARCRVQRIPVVRKAISTIVTRPTKA